MTTAKNFFNSGIQQFSGDTMNYNAWRQQIRAVLFEMDLLKVIDKSTPHTVNDEWKKSAQSAKNVLIMHLGDNLINTIPNDLSAKELFQKLDKTYNSCSEGQKIGLRKRISQLKYTLSQKLAFFLFSSLNTNNS